MKEIADNKLDCLDITNVYKWSFKNYLVLLMIMFASISSYAQYDSIPHDGIDRTYLLHLPNGYDGTSGIPLVIAMHGGFGNAYNIEYQSQLSTKADAENFIVVYPEGVVGGLLDISSWNAGWCCGYASNSDADDVGFIDALLDTLISLYAIDTNRIYATGMSNGGFMSYRLGCELPERIAAIAPVAASMAMVDCNPFRAVPVIDFHSYKDAHIPYYGGIGNGPSNHYNPPQDSVLNSWAEISNCVHLNDTIVHNAQYTFIKWTSCDCNSEVQYYITQDGGHSWPGGLKTTIGDSVSNYINATDLLWSFFQQHSLECNNSSVSTKITERNSVLVYPNPTNGILKIKSKLNYEQMETSVFNAIGQNMFNVKNKTELDIRHLPKGAYFVAIKLDGTTNFQDIIKIE